MFAELVLSFWLITLSPGPPELPILDWTPLQTPNSQEWMCLSPPHFKDLTGFVIETWNYIDRMDKRYKFAVKPGCTEGYVYSCDTPKYAWREGQSCTVYKCKLRKH